MTTLTLDTDADLKAEARLLKTAAGVPLVCAAPSAAPRVAKALPQDAVTRGDLIQWIYPEDVDSYIAQGWIVSKMLGHHGARKAARNFMAVMHGL